MSKYTQCSNIETTFIKCRLCQAVGSKDEQRWKKDGQKEISSKKYILTIVKLQSQIRTSSIVSYTAFYSPKHHIK